MLLTYLRTLKGGDRRFLSGSLWVDSVSSEAGFVVEGLSTQVVFSKMLHQLFRCYVFNINVLELLKGRLVENGPEFQLFLKLELVHGRFATHVELKLITLAFC